MPACLLRAETRVETAGRHRCEIRYFASSRPLSATEATTAVREHWAIEMRARGTAISTVPNEPQSRRRR